MLIQGAFLAAQVEISVGNADKWLERWRASGASALVDRRSVRRTQRRTLDPQQLHRAVDLRHERCTLRRVARVLAAPLSTVGRVLKSLGLGRLKNLQPAEPVRRYQWARPGDMIHVDTKQLARFERVGHRITGDRRLGSSRGRVTRKPMWPSTTPHDWISSRFCRMRSRRQQWDFCCGPWLGSMPKGSRVEVFSPKTAAPTARNPGETPAEHLGSHQNGPGRTPREPMAKPSGSSRHCLRSGRIQWL